VPFKEYVEHSSVFVKCSPQLMGHPTDDQLNPIELVWVYVKQHVLANICPKDLLT